MDRLHPDGSGKARGWVEAAQFWEARRLPYNAILTLIVLLWLVLTWPQFRPALTAGALGKLMVLALLANVCYCFAYGGRVFSSGRLASGIVEALSFRGPGSGDADRGCARELLDCRRNLSGDAARSRGSPCWGANARGA
jgi:hypothetical protein